MTGRGMNLAARVGCRVALASVLTASALLMQPDVAEAQSTLEQVEQLTRMGRTEEARDELIVWWQDERSDATRRELQRGLWLRGRLTVDPVQAELDFRRLVVLYPSGQFTPDAVMRLAQAAFAMGDEGAARGYVATLARDYPRSDARSRAEAWLADAGPVPPAGDIPTRTTSITATESQSPASEGEGTDEPPMTTDAAGSATDPTGAEEASAGDATETEDPARDDPAVPEEAAEPVMNYYVQLGAFGEEERAIVLFEEVKGAGVDVRVVRVEGSQFTHVRVGRFAERSAAVDLLEELTAQGIGAALVRDDRPESLIRD
jgi:cell division septation protein DedD